MGKTCSPNTEEGPALRQHETVTSPWVEERLAWSRRRDRRSVRRRQLGRDRKRALEPSEPLTPAERAQALLQLALRASSPPPSQRPLQPGVRLVSSHLVVTVRRSLSWGQPPECRGWQRRWRHQNGVAGAKCRGRRAVAWAPGSQRLPERASPLTQPCQLEEALPACLEEGNGSCTASSRGAVWERRLSAGSPRTLRQSEPGREPVQIKNHVHRISTGRIFTEIKARPGGAAPEKPRLVRHNLTPVGLCTNGSRGGRFTPTEGGCSSTRLSPTAAGLSERREDALRSGRAGTVPGGPPLPPLEPRAHARSGDWWN
ncbi:uncharacterized protein [Desmodus rotundus]|uniref:uncharacterized protein n=1 Tax=Desmodus rotundus TaxID=9430 RepID=UPI0039E60D0E